MTRDRQWLRAFLNLGARRHRDDVPEEDVERQEDTVLRALEVLEKRPGVVLADEVGMGKTYEALGVVAAARHETPGARILILTPGRELNTKWVEELHRFGEGEPPVYRGFLERFRSVGHISEYLTAANEAEIVVAPITIFNSVRGAGMQTYLLSLYFHYKRRTDSLHGNTINAIMRRFRDGSRDVVDVDEERFLDFASLADVEPHLEAAFGVGDPASITLDRIFEEQGLEGFDNVRLVREGLNHARYQLVRRLTPPLDLLILDEAHKLKNAHTVRSRAVETVFRKKFRRAVFLTATPFQLDVGELRQVFRLFSLATSASETMEEEVESLFANIRAYQDAYNGFERLWTQTDPAVAGDFRRLFDSDPTLEVPLDDPSHQAIADHIRRLRDLKSKAVEPAFRSWMIRSLRESKRTYRHHERRKQDADGPAILPFLIYERFIAELFHSGHRTHKVAAEINMASSFGAARDGALLAGDDDTRFEGDAEAYQRLLRELLSQLDDDMASHPKTRHVVHDALAAAEQGEKTLVFCGRVATLAQLARDLRAAWRRRAEDRWVEAMPELTREEVFDKVHPNLQKRMHDSRDALYLALREPYCQTLLYMEGWGLEHLELITEGANEALSRVRTIKSSAEKIDYQLTKRCVEHAAAKLFAERHPTADDHQRALERLTHPDYVSLGIDLEQDELEGDHQGEHPPGWSISRELAQLILEPRRHLWKYLRGPLDASMSADGEDMGPWDQRVRIVERIARYLTLQDVLFLPDLLDSARKAGVLQRPISSRPLLDHLPTFWASPPGLKWSKLLGDFIYYFTNRDPRERVQVLDDLLSKPKFVSQTKEGESRERLRRAFNTPLYPMVLLANEVMQEGLDLHKSCARVIHHDLAWNPAQLEQRVGRVDRIGSLTFKRRKRNPDATLDILYPLVARTVDERMYRVVKTREKWLEFLLGAPPDFEAYNFDETPPPKLPEGLAEELRIDLRPRSAAG